MPSLNKVIVIGHLGQDPETRYLPSGDAVTNVSLATSETWKDKSGEKQEHTEWHRCAFFGKLAEISGEYLKKGALVYVEGKLRTRKWSDKEGKDRYSTEIIGDRMLMLGGKGEKREPGPDSASPKKDAPAHKAGGFDEMDDDIPF